MRFAYLVSIPFLVLFTISLGGCKTTETLLEWHDIPHEKSELTIVSDTFDVVNLKEKRGDRPVQEMASLSISGERVGFVYLEQTPDNYCGYTQDSIWNFFDLEWVEKYRKNAGVQNSEDVKLQYRKNQHGEIWYQDVKGTNKRCMIVAELGLGGYTGVCTGTYFIYGIICRGANSSGVEKLDKQVFQLMNDLSFIGAKKELIRKSSRSSATVAKRRSGMGYYTDEVVCKFAIYAHGDTPTWDNNRYVPEAKRRGLTLEDCLKYVARKPDSQPDTTKASHSSNTGTIEERLAKLKELLDQGLLTEGEAASKRKELLQGL